ncbi:MAG: nucleotide exchange factor GrpE, partial [Bacteroidales bacterium]
VSDNKNDKNSKDMENVNQNELSGEEGLIEVTSDSETESEQPADKVVPEEESFKEKLAEMQDKYLRISAEFDNYRKRTLKEKMEISKYAGENILTRILPVMDDFERALKHMEDATDCTGMKEGIDLIYVKLSEFLNKEGLKEIDSLNTNFNVDLHDAVAKIPITEEDQKGKVVEVLQKGYYLQDKVIRHSKVVVGE